MACLLYRQTEGSLNSEINDLPEGSEETRTEQGVQEVAEEAWICYN